MSKSNYVKEVIKEAGEREKRVKVDKKYIKIERKAGYLYFTKGDPIGIYSVKMQHRGRTKSRQTQTLVLKTRAERNNKYLYYVSGDNYLSRALRKGRK